MSKKAKSENPWAEVKKKCGLNHEEVVMAKRLGLNPKKLIANESSRKFERWKEPVSVWIKAIYEKRFGSD